MTLVEPVQQTIIDIMMVIFLLHIIIAHITITVIIVMIIVLHIKEDIVTSHGRVIITYVPPATQLAMIVLAQKKQTAQNAQIPITCTLNLQTKRNASHLAQQEHLQLLLQQDTVLIATRTVRVVLV